MSVQKSQVTEFKAQIKSPRVLTTYTYGRIIQLEMKKVVVTELTCTRCNHSWYARRPQPPKVCPNCKRQDWNIPKAKTA